MTLGKIHEALSREAEQSIDRVFRNAALFDLLIKALSDHGTQYRDQGLRVPIIIEDNGYFMLSFGYGAQGKVDIVEKLTLEEMVKGFMAALIDARQKAANNDNA